MLNTFVMLPGHLCIFFGEVPLQILCPLRLECPLYIPDTSLLSGRRFANLSSQSVARLLTLFSSVLHRVDVFSCDGVQSVIFFICGLCF